MKNLLEKRGDWTAEDEEKIEQLQELYFSKLVTIEEIKMKQRKSKQDKENITTLQEDADKIYKEFVDLSIYKNTFFENTIEKKAEDDLINYRMVKLCMNENDQPIWESLEAYMETEDSNDLDKLKTDCVIFWKGISSPLSEGSPARRSGNENIE
jgi:hypothetical protein